MCKHFFQKVIEARWRVSLDQKWVEIEGIGVYNAEKHHFGLELSRGHKEKENFVELWEGGPVVSCPTDMGWVEYEPDPYWTFQLSLEIQGCMVFKRGIIDQFSLNLCLPRV